MKGSCAGFGRDKKRRGLLDWYFNNRPAPQKPREGAMARTTPMRIEPKTFFANERTFLSWCVRPFFNLETFMQTLIANDRTFCFGAPSRKCWARGTLHPAWHEHAMGASFVRQEGVGTACRCMRHNSINKHGLALRQGPEML